VVFFVDSVVVVVAAADCGGCPTHRSILTTLSYYCDTFPPSRQSTVQFVRADIRFVRVRIDCILPSAHDGRLGSRAGRRQLPDGHGEEQVYAGG